MNKFLIDSYNDFTQYIDTESGFLHINGVVARSGLQAYLNAELGNMEEPTKLVNVYRPSEEVIKKESLDSYLNAPVTDDHPTEFVTVHNSKDLIKGSVATIETYNKDGIDYIKAKLVVTDTELINKITNGKMEISAGYSQTLLQEKGEWEGIGYDYIQTNIKINHVAIVESARCGDACKLVFDNNNIIDSENTTKGIDSMHKIKIGDAQVEVCDTVKAHIDMLEAKAKTKDAMTPEEMKAIISEVIAAMKAEEAKEPETMDEEEENIVDEEAEEEKEKAMDSKIEAIIFAKEIGLNVSSKDSLIDIKKAVIAAKSEMVLDGKNDAYIDASFDMVKIQVAKDSKKELEVEQSHKKSFDGFDKPKDSNFANLKDKEY